ncbi:N-6 DNA methylase [Curtobacterium sp. APC 4022]|uniref:N-6 DNA methylase n=1 Tax=Curtobacterium sp. APC 4022 TaxID=3035201 RepID=UPI0025B4F98E|nr:N-6 DNA methylase [Curtobacterium sp. APC 4022]MDN3478298.1 N-6 DNA methylase [Curtobacterium sp. APC 4022]
MSTNSPAAVSKFCALTDLSNESSVEQFFVSRLLTDLGYPDNQILPKSALKELTLSASRQSEKWRPDYAITASGRVRWIVEAKGVTENLDQWVGQASSYCFELNKSEADNPVEFYVLSNGSETRLYKWDSAIPLMTLPISSFVDGNADFDQLRKFLDPHAFQNVAIISDRPHTLRRVPVSELNQHFAWVHRTIYKREAMSYTAAFMEFVKVIFLKLWSDRKAHASTLGSTNAAGSLTLPASEVLFSRSWIESMSATQNPLDTLFQDRLNEFEEEISEGKKRRIFARNEHLLLSAETLRAITERLETIDLISIDADLNGRMFETFLNSTLRGKDLGQFFTPRSVVKLATRLAQLKAREDHLDRVMDACCGTGGFLIESLSDMWAKIDSNASYSSAKKAALKKRVANESMIGVDVARDPALARIARINMYLHGDGGSRIFQLDSLDKKTKGLLNDDTELKAEKKAFRDLVADGMKKDAEGHQVGVADVILTNPPFAKEYDRKDSSHAELLDDYVLAFDNTGGAHRPLASVGSMVLFFERYHDLLASGGRMITVVDDSILGAAKNKGLRKWLRSKFVINAVISLPGDAFQRSQARVKTSLLLMTKKTTPDESQPSVFMYYCSSVGIDDSPRQRVLPIDAINRERANAEIATVVSIYKNFQAGEEVPAELIVPAEAISERMDVKAVMPSLRERPIGWVEADLVGRKLSSLVARIEAGTSDASRFVSAEAIATPDDAVDGLEAATEGLSTDLADTPAVTATDDTVQYLRVRYDGACEPGDIVSLADIPKQTLTRVRTGDLVVSHINAVHGAVGLVPEELDGSVVTNEYTVCQIIGDIDAYLVWALLRSPETRADMIIRATGIGRTRVNWDILKDLTVPEPPPSVTDEVLEALRLADEAESTAKRLRAQARETVGLSLHMDTQLANDIITAFKPPR